MAYSGRYEVVCPRCMKRNGSADVVNGEIASIGACESCGEDVAVLVPVELVSEQRAELLLEHEQTGGMEYVLVIAHAMTGNDDEVERESEQPRGIRAQMASAVEASRDWNARHTRRSVLARDFER